MEKLRKSSVPDRNCSIRSYAFLDFICLFLLVQLKFHFEKRMYTNESLGYQWEQDQPSAIIILLRNTVILRYLSE